MQNLEAARHRARSSSATVAGLTGLWAVLELLVNQNHAAFAGFTAASLMAWLVRFLLTPEGVRQLLQVFNVNSGGAS